MDADLVLQEFESLLRLLYLLLLEDLDGDFFWLGLGGTKVGVHRRKSLIYRLQFLHIQVLPINHGALRLSKVHIPECALPELLLELIHLSDGRCLHNVGFKGSLPVLVGLCWVFGLHHAHHDIEQTVPYRQVLTGEVRRIFYGLVRGQLALYLQQV